MPKPRTIKNTPYKKENLVQAKKGKELKGRRSCWVNIHNEGFAEIRLIEGIREITSPRKKNEIIEMIHKGLIYYDKTEEPMENYTPFVEWYRRQNRY